MFISLRLLLVSTLLALVTSTTSGQIYDKLFQNYNTKQLSRFTENKGQVTDQNGNLRTEVKYIYNAPGFKAVFKDNSFSYELYTVEKSPKQISEASGQPEAELKRDKFKQHEYLTIKAQRIDINLLGANQHPEIIVEGKSADYNNYYLTHTPEEGVQKVHNYTKLTYKNIWHKIDLVFYAKKEGELKYDIVVHPGGNLDDVSFGYDGSSSVKSQNKKLQLGTALGMVEETIPLSYLAENKRNVIINYAQNERSISFKGKYDKSKTLIIDPVISWAIYGGSHFEIGSSLAVDSSLNTYLGGYTYSKSNIATLGTHQTVYLDSGDSADAFVIKFDGSGTRKWGTYFGSSYNDQGNAVAIDAAGNVYLAGSTTSPSGIASDTSASQSTLGGSYDAFLVKFDSSGTRQWSTYYGGFGNDFGYGVAVDTAGDIYLGGHTRSKSMATIGAYQTTQAGSTDGFIAKFNSNGMKQWATYFGGSSFDEAMALTTDAFGFIYLAGYTYSTTGIASPGAFQSSMAGASDFFLTKFSSAGARIWSTYYGGSGVEEGYSVAVDTAGNIYMAGITGAGFADTALATKGAHQTFNNGQIEALIAKFDSSGTRLWSSYYGGSGQDYGQAVIASPSGHVYLGGNTTSFSDIASPGAYNGSGGGAFLVKFTSSGSRSWGTYFNSSAFGYENVYAAAADAQGNVYFAGNTSTGATWDTYDAFVLKVSSLDVGIAAIDSVSVSYCGETKINVHASVKNFSSENDLDSVYIGWSLNGTLQSAKKHTLSLKSGDTSQSFFLGSVTLSHGKPAIKVWTYKPNGKMDDERANDTLKVEIPVYRKPDVRFTIPGTCEGEIANITNTTYVTSGKITSYLWRFGDGTTSTDTIPVKTYDSVGTYTVWLVATTNNGCKDSVSSSINIFPRTSPAFQVTNACSGESIGLVNTSAIGSGQIVSFLWSFGDNTTSILNSPNKTYSTPGTYTITLKTVSDSGCEDSISQLVTIYPRVNVDFIAANACLTETVQFAHKSSVSSGTISSILWRFGDGTISTDSAPVKTYTSSDTFDVWLIATNSEGCKDSISKKIIIYTKPTADFLIGSGCAGSNINFTNTTYILTGTVSSYLWDFGDGQTDTLKNPTHKYITVGTYSVKLTAMNNFGCTDTIIKDVEVYAVPQAIFSANDICVTDSFQFTDEGKGATNWHWKFGDNSHSFDQHPKYKYSLAGKYDVWLIASNANGCIDSVMRTITVDSTCVWPGDANSDKVVDVLDVLALGLAYSDTGSIRADTSTTWIGHYTKDWLGSFLSGANHKHADSDGNGIVSNLDTNAVTRNYSKTHAKKGTKNRGKSTDPLLKVEIQNDSLKAGDILVAQIILGESSLPAKDVYGLAFSLNYNEDYFSSVVIDYSGNWLGSNTLGYSNITNGLDMALTKTDQKNSTGSGRIATISFTLKNNQVLELEQLKLEIVDNILISADEQVIPTNIVDDSVKIYKEPNSIYNTNKSQVDIRIYPNPFTSYTDIQFTLEKSSIVNLKLYDMTGKSYEIYTGRKYPAGKHNYRLDTKPYNLKPGIYILKLENDGIPAYKRIVKTD